MLARLNPPPPMAPQIAAAITHLAVRAAHTHTDVWDIGREAVQTVIDRINMIPARARTVDRMVKEFEAEMIKYPVYDGPED